MPSCLKERKLPIVQERPPLSGPLRVGTPELYHPASPGRVHSRTVSHSGAEVYEGNSLWGACGLESPLDAAGQSVFHNSPVSSVTGKKTARLGDQQPLLSWEPRSDLAKLLELPPRAGCVPGEVTPLQGLGGQAHSCERQEV